MSASLQPAASALADALRGLERTLQDSRSCWDDSARQTFDRRHGDAILAGGRSGVRELQALARELDAANSALAALG